MMLVIGAFSVEGGGPFLRGGDDLIAIAAAQLDAGTVTYAIFRPTQQIEETLNGFAGDFDRFHRRPFGRGHAVDAPVFAVAVRIAQIVLHVADDRVVPVAEVDRAVRAHLDVGGAEIRVGGRHDVFLKLRAE